jgi:hypothetical protein
MCRVAHGKKSKDDKKRIPAIITQVCLGEKHRVEDTTDMSGIAIGYGRNRVP